MILFLIVALFGFGDCTGGAAVSGLHDIFGDLLDSLKNIGGYEIKQNEPKGNINAYNNKAFIEDDVKITINDNNDTKKDGSEYREEYRRYSGGQKYENQRDYNGYDYRYGDEFRYDDNKDDRWGYGRYYDDRRFDKYDGPKDFIISDKYRDGYKDYRYGEYYGDFEGDLREYDYVRKCDIKEKDCKDGKDCYDKAKDRTEYDKCGDQYGNENRYYDEQDRYFGDRYRYYNDKDRYGNEKYCYDNYKDRDEYRKCLDRYDDGKGRYGYEKDCYDNYKDRVEYKLCIDRYFNDKGRYGYENYCYDNTKGRDEYKKCEDRYYNDKGRYGYEKDCYDQFKDRSDYEKCLDRYDNDKGRYGYEKDCYDRSKDRSDYEKCLNRYNVKGRYGYEKDCYDKSKDRSDYEKCLDRYDDKQNRYDFDKDCYDNTKGRSDYNKCRRYYRRCRDYYYDRSYSYFYNEDDWKNDKDCYYDRVNLVGLGRNDREDQLIRPCALDDRQCIRKYLARNSKCKPAYGPIPDPLYLRRNTVYFPFANITVLRIRLRVTGLSSIKISEFYVNKDTKNLVIALDFMRLNFTTPNAYFRYKRTAKESIVLNDYATLEFKSGTFTAVIPKIPHLRLDLAEVHADIDDLIPRLFIGPKAYDSKGLEEVIRLGQDAKERVDNIFFYFGETTGHLGVGFLVAKKWKDNYDPDVIAGFARLNSDLPTLTQEELLLQSQLYTAIYIQENLCDFGLKLISV